MNHLDSNEQDLLKIILTLSSSDGISRGNLKKVLTHPHAIEQRLLKYFLQPNWIGKNITDMLPELQKWQITKRQCYTKTNGECLYSKVLNRVEVREYALQHMMIHHPELWIKQTLKDIYTFAKKKYLFKSNHQFLMTMERVLMKHPTLIPPSLQERFKIEMSGKERGELEKQKIEEELDEYAWDLLPQSKLINHLEEFYGVRAKTSQKLIPKLISDYPSNKDLPTWLQELSNDGVIYGQSKDDLHLKTLKMMVPHQSKKKLEEEWIFQEKIVNLLNMNNISNPVDLYFRFHPDRQTAYRFSIFKMLIKRKTRTEDIQLVDRFLDSHEKPSFSLLEIYFENKSKETRTRLWSLLNDRKQQLKRVRSNLKSKGLLLDMNKFKLIFKEWRSYYDDQNNANELILKQRKMMHTYVPELHELVKLLCQQKYRSQLTNINHRVHKMKIGWLHFEELYNCFVKSSYFPSRLYVDHENKIPQPNVIAKYELHPQHFCCAMCGTLKHIKLKLNGLTESNSPLVLWNNENHLPEYDFTNENDLRLTDPYEWPGLRYSYLSFF